MLPRDHRDTHRKNVRRSNGIWGSCSDTEHARISQCLRRLVLDPSEMTVFNNALWFAGVNAGQDQLYKERHERCLLI